MSSRLRQRQDFGLSGTEGIAQFLNVGQPGTVESHSQFSVRHRLLSQEELDVGEVFRVGAAHHFGENEIQGRWTKQLQVDEGPGKRHATVQPVRLQEYIRLRE